MLFANETPRYTMPDGGLDTRIYGIFVINKAIDPASIGATASAETTFTQYGVNPGDVVFASVPASLETGLAYSGARVSAANTIAVRLTNVTAGAIDGVSRTWQFVVIKTQP